MNSEQDDRLEQEWWSAWWRDNYSWEGLRAHKIEGGGPNGEVTLQDYWRRDPETGEHRTDSALIERNELIRAPDGTWWHVAHAPEKWSDGRVEKSTWLDNALDTLIAARLGAAQFSGDTFNERGPNSGADGRAQLQGAVLLQFPPADHDAATPIHIAANRTAFLRHVSLQGAQIGPGAAFSNALFADEADFRNAVFTGDVWFEEFVALGPAAFEQAEFHAPARFMKARFIQSARFTSAKFQKAVWFESAKFGDVGWFVHAIFHGEANFDGVSCADQFDFIEAQFHGAAKFTGLKAEKLAVFTRCSFAGDCIFQFSQFAYPAWFLGAVFSSIAAFEGASFNAAIFRDAVFNDHGWFTDAQFARDASFTSTRFTKEAYFKNAKFSAEARFDSAHFQGEACFEYADFTNDAWFTTAENNTKGARFSGPAKFGRALFRAGAQFTKATFEARMSFERSRFFAAADFAGIALPANEVHWRYAFLGALFEAPCDMRAAGHETGDSTQRPDKDASARAIAFARAPSLIAGATFDRGILLDDIAHAEERRAHDDAVETASAIPDENQRERTLEALEDGALRLKRAMEANGNFARAQRFHRLELRARAKKHGTKRSEKFVSWLYKWTADYGEGIARPLTALAGLVAVFAIVFWSWEGGATSDGPAKFPGGGPIYDYNFSDAVRYSLSRTFPFGPWALNDDRLTSAQECGFASRLQALDVAPSAVTATADALPDMVRCRPRFSTASAETALTANDDLAGHRLAVGLIGTLETLLSLPLYFLFGLAVRRKFQIN